MFVSLLTKVGVDQDFSDAKLFKDTCIRFQAEGKTWGSQKILHLELLEHLTSKNSTLTTQTQT